MDITGKLIANVEAGLDEITDELADVEGKRS